MARSDRCKITAGKSSGDLSRHRRVFCSVSSPTKRARKNGRDTKASSTSETPGERQHLSSLHEYNTVTCKLHVYPIRKNTPRLLIRHPGEKPACGISYEDPGALPMQRKYLEPNAHRNTARDIEVSSTSETPGEGQHLSSLHGYNAGLPQLE